MRGPALHTFRRNAAAAVLDRAWRGPTEIATAQVGEEPRTYAAFAQDVAAVAAVLRSLGVEPGDRVGFVANTNPDIIDHFIATLAIGAVFVPLNSLLSAEELDGIIVDAGCKVLVADAPLAQRLASRQEHLDARLIGLEDDGLPAGWTALSALVPAEVPELEPVDTDPDSLAVLMYTSGTTGLPKGVMISHRNLFGGVRDLSTTVVFGSGSGMLAMTPIFHIGALALVLATIHTGGRVVILPTFSPEGFYEAMEAHPITFTFGVPTMMQRIADLEDRFEAIDLSRVLLMCSAAPVPPVLLDRYLAKGARIIQGYGLTEAVGCVTLTEPCMSLPKLGSAGLPYPTTEVELRDAHGNVIEEPGVDGEIWVRSDTTVLGYWNRPDATAELYDDERWMRTGDAGRWDEDGYIYITDRVKDMVITGGENVYPAEVEKVLAGHPGIAEVAVVGTPHPEWGEAVTAVIVARSTDGLDLDALREWARPHLAGYKLPRRVELVDALPRNASGKVLKRDLRATFA